MGGKETVKQGVSAFVHLANEKIQYRTKLIANSLQNNIRMEKTFETMNPTCTIVINCINTLCTSGVDIFMGCLEDSWDSSL